MFKKAICTNTPCMYELILKIYWRNEEDHENDYDVTTLHYICSSLESAKIQAYIAIINSEFNWKRNKKGSYMSNPEHPWSIPNGWKMKDDHGNEHSLYIQRHPLDQALPIGNIK